MGHLSSKRQVCFGPDCCLPLFAFSLRNQTPLMEDIWWVLHRTRGKNSHTEETKCNSKKEVLVKALAHSKSALHERWQAFRFSLSSTDVTKRRNGAGCAAFAEDGFRFIAFWWRARFSLQNGALIHLQRLIWSCQPHPNTAVIHLHGPPHYASRKMPFRNQSRVTHVRTLLWPTCWGWNSSFFLMRDFSMTNEI